MTRKEKRPAGTGRHHGHRDTPRARRRDGESTTTTIVALTDMLYSRTVTRDGEDSNHR